MKTTKLFISVFVAFVMALSVSAQSGVTSKTAVEKTDTLKVWGACGMCEARIEKNAKEIGATSAEWNVETKMLTVTFSTEKTNVDAISKKMAEVGHDTRKYTADDKVYNALPACCKYERNK